MQLKKNGKEKSGNKFCSFMMRKMKFTSKNIFVSTATQQQSRFLTLHFFYTISQWDKILCFVFYLFIPFVTTMTQTRFCNNFFFYFESKECFSKYLLLITIDSTFLFIATIKSSIHAAREKNKYTRMLNRRT
jgi:hypothetical protein